MVFEHIEKLKQEYTDKYVVVREQVAELQRFNGLTGTVRTVNMSGRALVEFSGYNNIGWYDIDIDYLSVIEKPLPEEVEKPAAKKAAAKEKAPSKLEKARGERAPAATPGKMSVAEVLAAARTNASAGAAAPANQSTAAKPSGTMSVEEMLAAARAEKSGGAPPSPTASSTESTTQSADPKAALQHQLESARQSKSSPKPASGGTAAASKKAVDPKGMSVEQMLAAARAEKTGGATPAAVTQVADTASEEAPVEAEAEPPASASDGARSDLTSVEEQIAYCRKVDG
jgi:hypothetical protein